MILHRISGDLRLYRTMQFERNTEEQSFPAGENRSRKRQRYSRADNGAGLP